MLKKILPQHDCENNEKFSGLRENLFFKIFFKFIRKIPRKYFMSLDVLKPFYNPVYTNRYGENLI
jgi:hypothetical protein